MPAVGTTHHVRIAGHYYLVKPGSYQKRVAPQFGARFSTGDPDFNNLSIWQHWAQRCFIGGMDAEEWADDAMYDKGIGVDTSDHERVVLSRDLSRGAGANWTVSSNTANSSAGFKAIIFNSILYVLSLPASGSEGHLWKYDPGTDGWTRITSLDGQNITPRCIAAFDGKLYIGGAAVGTSTGKLIYGSGALSSWTVVSNPAGLGGTSTVTAMRSFQQKLYVAFSYIIWRQKDNQTWDGNTLFYKANLNSDSNGIVAMETHLGFLYMLSDNGHVHRTDGNSTFDIWSWDGQTRGLALRSFDGRLFVMTFEYTNTADVGYGCLYQMSGSAMTQLKRWGKPDQATIIPSLTVFDRRLWYGASNLLGLRDGFGVVCYDPVEDAHSIAVANEDTVTFAKGATPFRNYIMDDVIFFHGKLFAFARGHGAFFTPYGPRDRTDLGGAFVRKYDITAAGGGLTSTNGGWLMTSTYDAGTPGVKKLWRKIAVDYSLPSANQGIVIDYSLDNGANWTTLGTVTVVGNRLRKEFWLNNVIGTALKLRFTLRSTVATQSPVLYGFVVSYIPVPEPNWMWSMTLVLSSKQALLDGTVSTVDTEAEAAFLDDTYRSKQLVEFVDAEGQTWASNGPGVLIYDATFMFLDLNQPLECEVQLTLLEAVETY